MKKTLKFIAMLMCAVSFAWLSSCSKDYDDLIIGSWSLMQESSDGVNWHEPEWPAGVNFKTDGTAVILLFSVPVATVPYTIDGNTLVVDGNTGTIISLTSSELIVREESGDHTYAKYIKL
ncbi:MAG: hypothetical protein SPL12_09855 [Bacteroidales bacterium]|nr:hypothetical protein [Bacteroidales bacterium]